MKALLLTSLLCLPVFAENHDEGPDETMMHPGGGPGGPGGGPGPGPMMRRHPMMPPEMKEAMEKRRKLHMEIRKLAVELREAEDSKKEAKRKSLEKLVGELFDLHLKHREMKLEHLRREVGRLEKEVELGKSKREQLIKERMAELAGERVDFDW